MGQQFDLGFGIDTSGLQRAGTEALRAADQVAKLGDAERKLATDADKAAAALKQEGQAVNDNAAKKTALTQKTTELTSKLREQQGDVNMLAGAFRGQQGLVGGLDAAAQAGSRLLGGLGPITIAIGLLTVGTGLLGKAVWDMANSFGAAQDKMAAMEARLKSALGSTEAAKSSMAQLFEMTQKTGLGFTAAADAFGRVARNNASIGLTQAEMLQMSETVQKLGAASGASQGEMTGAMVQFGQALASGRLQGDELRSIMENLPPLAKAIADNFEKADGTIGITIGTLRKMGSEGELTSGKIADAVLRATDKAREDFDKLPTTMAQSSQRMSDAWEQMLATMGAKLQASQLFQIITNGATDFVNGINNVLAGPTEDEIIRTLQMRKEMNVAGTYRGPSNIGTGSAVFNPYAGNTWNEADEKRLTDMLAARDKRWQAQALQVFNEGQLKLIAPSSAVEAQTAEFAPLSEKVRSASNTVTSLNDAIANLNKAIERGGTAEYDVETLTANRDRLIGRLQAAQAAVNAVMTEAGKFAQSMSDSQLANEIGGRGGGSSIVSAAIQRQRADQKTSSAGGLSDYIDAGVNNALIRANQDLSSFVEKVAEAKAQVALIGASGAETIASEVERETAAARLQMFGIISDDKIDEWAKKYAAGLTAVKQATEDVRQAQEAYNAELDAATSRRMLGAGLGPVSQARAQMEAQLEQMALKNGVNDPEYLRAKTAMEEKANNDRIQAGRMSIRDMEKQIVLADRMQDIQTLSSDEQRVQAAIIQKKLQLEYDEVDAASQRYKIEVALTEQIERRKIADEKGTTQTRMSDAVDDGLNKIEGQFDNLWREVFTNGIEEGAEIFGKGMSDIILDIGAKMMTEMVYKPFEELTRAAARALANWAVQSLIGMMGGGQPSAQQQQSFGAGWGTFANGAAFDGMTSFAKGSAFANSIVDRPTLFSFAKGTKLGEMGEAGPEAIMPLERGSDGRLGVSARGVGVGGDVEVNIYDQRTGGEKVEVQEQRGSDGKRQLAIMIRDVQRGNIRSGDMDREMMTSYGAQRQLAKL